MKKPHPDLFSHDIAAAPGTGGTDLRMGSAKAKPLSAGQQRFNRLLASIEKFNAQIAQIQLLADTYRPLYASTLTPLREQQLASMRRMALHLDERLGRKGLTAAQKNSLIEILCGLCEPLAAAGDGAMAALHDKHSPKSLREMEEEEALGVRAMMKGVLGERLDVDLDDESLDPMARMEALLRAAREHAAHEEEQAQRRQAGKARKKPTAAQLKAGQQQQDAKTVLRQVYRQLASALHPDRELDPLERKRKTALMSEANAAYGRQDLVALLHIQLSIEQLEPGAIAEMPETKIAAMTTLLKQQAAELEDELMSRREHLQQEFQLDFFQLPTAATLKSQLAMEAEFLRDELAQMEEDLQMVQDDAGLKRWLKIQKQLARQMNYF
ncbi:MAG: hypothetical protein ABIQ90_17010 [Polaromonas sp.]